MKAFLFVAFLLFALTFPLSSQESALTFEKTEFVPTPFHETIYKMIAFCTGIEGDYASVRWYMAKMILVGDPRMGRQWVGAWAKTEETSEIILDREYVFDGYIVSHEVLHDLFRGNAPMDIANRCVLDWGGLMERER